MVDRLKEYAQSAYTDAELVKKRLNNRQAMPITKESLLYR